MQVTFEIVFCLLFVKIFEKMELIQKASVLYEKQLSMLYTAKDMFIWL